VRLRRDAAPAVRLPDFCDPREVTALVDGRPVEVLRREGGFLRLDRLARGQAVEVRYPLPESVEEVEIASPGFRRYRHRALWRGDTVLELRPAGEMPHSGYSEFDPRDVPVFYGEDGPGRLYRREHLRGQGGTPFPVPLQLDSSAIDFW